MSDHTIQFEEKIAYLEKTVSDLDEVVRDLYQQVREIRRDLTALDNQFDQHLADLHEQDIASEDH